MSVRLAAHLDLMVAALPAGSVILLRRGRETPTGIFERVVSELAKVHNIAVDWREPAPGDRSMVYRRDYRMVDDSDFIEAYFRANRVMEGGTGHLVEAALNHERSVFGWSVTPEGYVERIGEFEPTPVDGRSTARRVAQ